MKRLVGWGLAVWMMGLLMPLKTAVAQDGQVRGRVTEAEARVPLPGVQVALMRADTVVVGAVTDDRGRYRLRAPAGPYILAFRYVGYASHELVVTLAKKTLRRDVALRPEVVDLGEVKVEAGRDQDPADPAVSLTRFDARAVRTLAGGGEDVLRALQVLPGVLATSDYSNQLVIRGGTPDQNLILLDGIEVFSPYQLSGMGSLLNPALIRDVALYTGAFPAPYGDRLSSVLDVQNRDGRADQPLSGQVSANLATAGLVFEGRTGLWDGTWLLSGRRTYFDFFANGFSQRLGIFNDIAFPDFSDLQGRLVLRPAVGHSVRLSGLFSRDVLLRQAEEDLFGGQEEGGGLTQGDVRGRNAAGALTWLHAPDADRQRKVTLSYYRNDGQSGLSGGLLPAGGAISARATIIPPPVFGEVATAAFDFDQDYALEKTSLSGQWVRRRGRHLWEGGGGVDRLSNALRLQLDVNDFGRQVFDALLTADPVMGALVDSIDADTRYMRYHLYLQDRITLWGARVHLQPGLRYDRYALIGRHYVSPRLSASVQLGRATTLRLGAGRYVQSPGFEKLLDPDNLFNLARFERLDQLRAERAWHLGAGVSHHLGTRWLVRLEAYHKRLDDLITQTMQAVRRPTAVFNRAAPSQNVVGQLGLFDAPAYTIRDREVFVLTTDPVNAGTGRASGVELLLERRPGGEAGAGGDPWHGWLSYAYAHASRTQTVDGTTLRYPFDYDRRHTVNLTLGRPLGRRFAAALTWRLGTGFPQTPPVTFEPIVAIVDDPATGGPRGIVLNDPATGRVRLVPGYGGAGNINSARLPAYHRLDLRLGYTVPTWRGRSAEVYLDLINVYNRRNVLTYRYLIEAIEPPPGLPPAVRPAAKPVMFGEPVYMFPFIPSFGFKVGF